MLGLKIFFFSNGTFASGKSVLGNPIPPIQSNDNISNEQQIDMQYVKMLPTVNGVNFLLNKNFKFYLEIASCQPAIFKAISY